jgi:hypothetical protein
MSSRVSALVRLSQRLYSDSIGVDVLGRHATPQYEVVGLGSIRCRSGERSYSARSAPDRGVEVHPDGRLCRRFIRKIPPRSRVHLGV